MSFHLLLLNCCLYYSLSYIDRINHIDQKNILNFSKKKKKNILKVIMIIPAHLEKGKNCWLFVMGCVDMQLLKLDYGLHRCYSMWLAAIGCCDSRFSATFFIIESSEVKRASSFWKFILHGNLEAVLHTYSFRDSDITVT